MIEPNLEAINHRLNKEHSAAYLAYCVEYCLMKRKRKLTRPDGLKAPVDQETFSFKSYGGY